MIHTSRQLKALVRNMSKGDSAKAQIILRKYMMERFLERLSVSPYRNNLILKGGALVAAVVGLDNRSTMDVDATFKNLPLSVETARKTVEEIAKIQIDDGVAFEVKNTVPIMDDADYPGIRVMLNTALETMNIPLKIDLSTGDVITPHEIPYPLKLLFEERSISIMAYNLETVLAEKIETLLARGTANTRMRDFYDIFALGNLQEYKIDSEILKTAFVNTSEKRSSSAILGSMDLILNEVAVSPDMAALWKNYQHKYDYAVGIHWDDAILAVKKFCDIIRPRLDP